MPDQAAAACGIDAMFLEVHDDPANALSDANTVLDIQYLEVVLAQTKAIHETRNELRAYGEMTMSILQKQQIKIAVSDVMLPIERTPLVSERTLLKEALEIMDRHRLGSYA